jgi:hypothetical protein
MLKVLTLNDSEKILNFEKLFLKSNGFSEIDISIEEWNSAWRMESLEYYLPLGWSYGLFGENGELKAYFLAQPLVFFSNYTQSLWVELFSFSDENQVIFLLDTAYKLCRDKHFQKLIIGQRSINEHAKIQKIIEEQWEKTARFDVKLNFMDVTTSKMKEGI